MACGLVPYLAGSDQNYIFNEDNWPSVLKRPGFDDVTLTVNSTSNYDIFISFIDLIEKNSKFPRQIICVVDRKFCKHEKSWSDSLQSKATSSWSVILINIYRPYQIMWLKTKVCVAKIYSIDSIWIVFSSTN